MALFGLLILAFLFRLLTFKRFLPFTDYADELNMYVLALDWRHAQLAATYGASRVSDMLGSYPPLFVWLEMGIQSLLDILNGGRWLGAGEVMLYTRLLAVGFGILTTAFIYDTARIVGGRVAGAIAGLVWAIGIPILEYNSIAIPDPVVYFGCGGALWASARAFQHHSYRWALLGAVFALVAIYAKYVPVYALIPPGCALCWLTYKRAPGALRAWVLMVGMVGVAGIILVVNVSTQPLKNSEAQAARGDGAARLLDPLRNADNLQTMLAPIGAGLLLITVGSLIVIARKKRPAINPFLTALVLYELPVVPLSAVVSDTLGKPGPEIRHVMPGVIGLILLWSVGLAWIRKQGRSLRLLMAGLFVAWLIPSLFGTFALVVRFQPPHVVYQLWTWSDNSLPADGLIMMPPKSNLSPTWNRPWSGYDGQTSFQWWLENPSSDSTGQDLAKRGITYFVLDDSDRTRLDSEAFRRFLATLTPVKILRPATVTAGQPVFVYRTVPPRSTANVNFGGQIALVGYDLTYTAIDKPVTLRLYWKALRKPDANYSVFVHLTRPGEQQPIAQQDGSPGAARRLTLTWDDPQELYMSRDMTLQVAQGTPPGNYIVRVGLYSYLDGVRLRTAENTDSVELPIHLN